MPPTPKRPRGDTKQLVIRLHRSERADLEQRAARAGMVLSDYARDMLFPAAGDDGETTVLRRRLNESLETSERLHNQLRVICDLLSDEADDDELDDD